MIWAGKRSPAQVYRGRSTNSEHPGSLIVVYPGTHDPATGELSAVVPVSGNLFPSRLATVTVEWLNANCLLTPVSFRELTPDERDRLDPFIFPVEGGPARVDYHGMNAINRAAELGQRLVLILNNGRAVVLVGYYRADEYGITDVDGTRYRADDYAAAHIVQRTAHPMRRQ